jgi:hypothetical protein
MVTTRVVLSILGVAADGKNKEKKNANCLFHWFNLNEYAIDDDLNNL